MQTPALGIGAAGRHSGLRVATRSVHFPRRPSMQTSMQWQTPTATNFRFGFEITMYVAAR